MKSKRFCSLVFTILFIAGLISCDDYNIVEPRFYDEGDIFEIYSDRSYWHFGFALPCESYVEFYLLESAGNIVSTFVDGENRCAGFHGFYWDGRDDDGNKVKDGIYCLILKAGDYEHLRCFEYDDPEDYLP